jgi:hypothetical protein
MLYNHHTVNVYLVIVPGAVAPCSPEWGASSCTPSTRELVLRRDGCADVRLPAVLAALLDASTTTTTTSSSSSSSGGSLAAVMQSVTSSRCRQLLSEMRTSVQQDQDLLRQQGSAGGDVDGGLMSAVVQYRLAKKQLLAQFADA